MNTRIPCGDAVRVMAVVVAVCCTLEGGLVVQTSAGDTSTSGTVQQPVDRASEAGAAIVDITPPAGFATGGHGPGGSISRGTLTRLYARAIYLRAPSGPPLLFVSVESFAVPHVFRSRIQAKLKELGIDLPPSSIIVAATHTHQGPGNYLSATLYNKHASAVDGYSRAVAEVYRASTGKGGRGGLQERVTGGEGRVHVRQGHHLG